MPIAAVPFYLGTDFSEASPGLRFGMLLPIWTSREDQESEVRKRAGAKSREGQALKEMLEREGLDAVISCLCNENCCRQHGLKRLPGLWDKNDFAARRAWDAIKTLTLSDQERMKNLTLRQSALAATLPADSLLRLEATAVAPFTTGLGNEHPLENGFAFLNPYGLPYLAGSGVKGVLRQAARELASGEWGETHGWEASLPSPAGGRGAGGEGISTLDALFGRESTDGDTEHLRGALSFWDVIPQIEGSNLMVEIMTPHQAHYYQQKQERKTGDSTSPHDSGQPNPIAFLTVPPKSRFTFHVVCDCAHPARLAPDLLANDPATGKPCWQQLMEAAFTHAFKWLGFGAKTAVGYGAMRHNLEAEAEAAALQAGARRKEEVARNEAALAAMSPNLQEVEKLRIEIKKRLDQGRKLPVSDQFWGGHIKKLALTALENPSWTADEKTALANMLEEYAGRLMALDAKDLRKQLKLNALRGQT